VRWHTPNVVRLLIVLATAAGLALPAAACGTAPRGGLFGIVRISPARPVCLEGEPCTRPARRVWLVFSRSGREVGRERTGSDGSYRITLPRGAYAVTSPGGVIGRGLEPQRVSVPAGGYARVDFSLDIGIR
jgi:hypothetical protein